MINFLTLLGVFYIMVVVLGARQTRFIDLAGTLLLAMAPVSVLPLLNYNGILYRNSNQLVEQLQNAEPDMSVNAGVLMAALVMILVLVWMVALLYQAYKICSNFKGTKLITSFGAGIVLAFIISKYLVTLIH